MNVAFTEKEASEHIRDIHKRLTGKDMESFNVPSWMIEGLVSGGLAIAFVRPLTPLMQDQIIRSRVYEKANRLKSRTYAKFVRGIMSSVRPDVKLYDFAVEELLQLEKLIDTINLSIPQPETVASDLQAS